MRNEPAMCVESDKELSRADGCSRLPTALRLTGWSKAPERASFDENLFGCDKRRNNASERLGFQQCNRRFRRGRVRIARRAMLIRRHGDRLRVDAVESMRKEEVRQSGERLGLQFLRYRVKADERDGQR